MPDPSSQVPQIDEGVSVAQPVAEVPGGCYGGGVAGDGALPGAVVAQQGCDGGGERDDPGVAPGRGGVIQAGEQAAVLSPGPGQRLGAAGQARDRYRRRLRGPGGAGGTGLAAQDRPGASGGVLVVVKQPFQCLLPAVGRVGGGEILGVATDQVVHAVPAMARLGQQALALQGIQLTVGLVKAAVGQGSGCV